MGTALDLTGSQMLGLAVAALCAGAYLGRVHRQPSLVRSMLKLASVAVLAALAAGHAPGLSLALAVSALGDLALSRPGERAFLVGVLAFAVAHCVYVVLFLGLPGADLLNLLVAPRLWYFLGLSALAALVARMLFRHAGALRWAVLAYVPLILAMTLAALAQARPALWLGATMFLSSDLILAVERFLLAPSSGWRRASAPAIWLLYWGAQLVFFLALAT